MIKTMSGLLLSVFLLSPVAAHTAPEQDHIKVVGVGSIEEEPDQATLNITIEAKKPNLLAAKQEADNKYRSVIKVIKDLGIDDKDIKATRINANSEYEWRNNSRIYKGEVVSRSLAVTINDLEIVSPLMQKIVEGGVSKIDSFTTGFKDPKALQRLAIAAAADDAKSKAAFLAKRMGRELGAAYSITEQNLGAARPAFRGMVRGMAMEASPSMAASAPQEMFGSQKIEATVNVSFGLL